jgi:hypothetical protein
MSGRQPYSQMLVPAEKACWGQTKVDPSLSFVHTNTFTTCH